MGVGEGDSHIEEAGIIVILLRGVNFGFWYHLGCSWHNAIICRKGLVRVAHEETYFICILLIHFIYSIHLIKVFYNINN